mmetsp:Transcript_19583/g.32326  ORF Transcript_19583/g.32326 Transcript_19583/m.32326 type:complete len:85 (+) Transcript_19583:841-1095(+)
MRPHFTPSPPASPSPNEEIAPSSTEAENPGYEAQQPVRRTLLLRFAMALIGMADIDREQDTGNLERYRTIGSPKKADAKPQSNF